MFQAANLEGFPGAPLKQDEAKNDFQTIKPQPGQCSLLHDFSLALNSIQLRAPFIYSDVFFISSGSEFLTT